MFLGVRGMAELPIESFKTEGLLHIVDLSTRDPLFILPTLTMSSLALSLYLGAEGIPMHDFPPIFKKIMMLIPVVAFIPVAYFPAGMSLYWVTSNFFSLGQFLLFRSEFGKKLFRIPPKRDNPNGWGMGQFTDKVSFAEQFTKMVETAQEAANTQAKLQGIAQVHTACRMSHGAWCMVHDARRTLQCRNVAEQEGAPRRGACCMLHGYLLMDSTCSRVAVH